MLRETQTSARTGLVYTADAYGKDGYQVLVEGARAAGVCFVTTVPVPVATLRPVPSPGLTEPAEHDVSSTYSYPDPVRNVG